GVGATGTVYRATDTGTGRTVAVKALRPGRADPRAHQILLREARYLQAVHHPRIVGHIGTVEHDGQLYVVQENIPGRRLEHWKQNRSLIDVVEVYVQVAEAVAALHEHRLVHRDLK